MRVVLHVFVLVCLCLELYQLDVYLRMGVVVCVFVNCLCALVYSMFVCVYGVWVCVWCVRCRCACIYVCG